MFDLILLAALASQAVTAKEDIPDSASTEATANFFANCAGVWDFNAEIMGGSGKESVAEQLKNLGNGAQTTALWLLASQHALDTGEATRYGSWGDLVLPKRENAIIRMRALAEMEDYEQIKIESEVCSKALENQEEILQLMRKDRIRETQKKESAETKQNPR